MPEQSFKIFALSFKLFHWHSMCKFSYRLHSSTAEPQRGKKRKKPEQQFHEDAFARSPEGDKNAKEYMLEIAALFEERCNKPLIVNGSANLLLRCGPSCPMALVSHVPYTHVYIYIYIYIYTNL